MFLTIRFCVISFNLWYDGEKSGAVKSTNHQYACYSRLKFFVNYSTLNYCHFFTLSLDSHNLN